jgi:hypothetical protein
LVSLCWNWMGDVVFEDASLQNRFMRTFCICATGVYKVIHLIEQTRIQRKTFFNPCRVLL